MSMLSGCAPIEGVEPHLFFGFIRGLSLLSVMSQLVVIITYMTVRHLSGHPAFIVKVSWAWALAGCIWSTKLFLCAAIQDNLDRESKSASFLNALGVFGGMAFNGWGFVFSYNLYHALQRPFDSLSPTLLAKYHLYVWGTSALGALVCIAINGQEWSYWVYQECGYNICRTHGDYHRPLDLFVYGPLYLYGLFSLWTLLLAVSQLWKGSPETRSIRRKFLLRHTVWVAILLATWVWPLMNRTYALFDSAIPASTLYADAMSSSVCGFLVSVIWAMQPVVRMSLSDAFARQKKRYRAKYDTASARHPLLGENTSDKPPQYPSAPQGLPIPKPEDQEQDVREYHPEERTSPVITPNSSFSPAITGALHGSGVHIPVMPPEDSVAFALRNEVMMCAIEGLRTCVAHDQNSLSSGQRSFSETFLLGLTAQDTTTQPDLDGGKAFRRRLTAGGYEAAPPKVHRMRLVMDGSPLHFEFTIRAPGIFEKLRATFQVLSRELALSLGYTEQSSLYSPRHCRSRTRSGSFVCESDDMKFLVKSLNPSEVKTVNRTIVAYADHMTKNRSSTLVRLLGSYAVSMGQARWDFVFFAKLFPTMKVIDELYCLSHTPKAENFGPNLWVRGIVRALNNEASFIRAAASIDVGPRRPALMERLRADLNFLAHQRITDYAVLVAITSAEACVSDNDGGVGVCSPIPCVVRNTEGVERSVRVSFGVVDMFGDWGVGKALSGSFQNFFNRQQTSVSSPVGYASRIISLLDRHIT